MERFKKYTIQPLGVQDANIDACLQQQNFFGGPQYGVHNAPYPSLPLTFQSSQPPFAPQTSGASTSGSQQDSFVGYGETLAQRPASISISNIPLRTQAPDSQWSNSSSNQAIGGSMPLSLPNDFVFGPHHPTTMSMVLGHPPTPLLGHSTTSLLGHSPTGKYTPLTLLSSIY